MQCYMVNRHLDYIELVITLLMLEPYNLIHEDKTAIT